MSLPSVQKGDKFSTNYGRCVVLQYRNAYKVKIKFLKTGYIRWARVGELRNGRVKDPYFPLIYGIGYFGVGNFANSKPKKLYNLWIGMFSRCYREDLHEKEPTYIGCKVDKVWHNYQNFAEWVTSQPYWNTPGFQLDKDLRVLGNKKYSPKYCSFVPSRVNSILHRIPYDKKRRTEKRLKVRRVARQYKAFIHPEVYESLMKWK